MFCQVEHIKIKIGIGHSILFSRSDSRVARTTASGAADSDLIPSRVKPMNLKFVFTAPCLKLSIKGTV